MQLRWFANNGSGTSSVCLELPWLSVAPARVTGSGEFSLHSQLAKLNDQMDAASAKAQGLVSNMLLDEMRLRPDLDCWSVAECLEHLSLTSASFIERIEDASQHARQRQIFGTASYRMDLIGRVLNWTMRPQAFLKVRTQAKFQPDIIEPVEDVLPRFLSMQERLKSGIAKADGIDLNKVIVQTPFSKRLKYNLYSCFVLIVTHQQRHLWQAENAKQAVVRDR